MRRIVCTITALVFMLTGLAQAATPTVMIRNGRINNGRLANPAPPAATYTVTYDGNYQSSGSPPVDSNTYVEGATVTVLANTGFLNKDGGFATWNTAADGSGTNRAPGSTFTMGTTNVTLYAIYFACLTSGTRILLADGGVAEVQDLKPGDVLLGSNGARNKVVKLSILSKADRKVFAFNGGRYFFTEGHPFMTRDGWKAIDIQESNKKHPDLHVRQLGVGDEIVTRDGFVRVESIQSRVLKDSVVYNPVLNGTHDYYAEGFLVHNPKAP